MNYTGTGCNNSKTIYYDNMRMINGDNRKNK